MVIRREMDGLMGRRYTNHGHTDRKLVDDRLMICKRKRDRLKDRWKTETKR